MKTKITVSGVLEDLQNGLTRTAGGKHYNEEVGSIQEKYGLTATEVKALFQHDKLKGKKTIVQKELSFELIDDVEETVEEEVVEEEVVEANNNSQSSEHILSL